MTKGNKGRFLLLYGSQTGQAKAIAEEICENAPSHGLQPEIHCFSMTDKKFSIEKESCIVIIVSTTGDGEPPDTACKFWRRIKKKTIPDDYLAGLNYALLGLGDSNYNNFCRNPKNFDQRFEKLGAKRLCPSGFADDAVGLELVAEPWMDGLWPALRKHLSIEGNTTTESGIQETADNSKQPNISSENAIDNLCLNASSAGVLFVETDTGDVPNDSQKDERTSLDREDENKLEMSNTQSNSIATRTDQSISLDLELSNIQTSRLSARTESNQNISDGENLQKEHGAVQPDDCVVDTATNEAPSLTHSVPPLSESGLTLPLLSPSYLQVQFQQGETMSCNPLSPQGNASYPSARSTASISTIVSATKLTRDNAVKTALDLELDISNTFIDYQPGDTFSIICPNTAAEVDQLLQRLGLWEHADSVFTLRIIADTKKRRAAIPDYISQPCTPRHALTYCCDIRTPLKKACIRMLAAYAESETEKRRLQELCSKQGSGDYGSYVREGHTSILDALIAFPSCNPPLERLIEHLPRLLPRPYSISSSPLTATNRMHFVFNLLEFTHSSGVTRHGVCTGWLHNITQAIQRHVEYEPHEIANDMGALSVQRRPEVLIFARTNTHFRLPDDPTTPIIMIGPGTGVAPFVGFLQHREIQLQRAANDSDIPVKFGPAWLFFGCRHEDRDYLYRDKLQHFVDCGVLTKLAVSFSRDAQVNSNPAVQKSPRYVQDNLRLYAADIMELLLEKHAVLYVCGDAKHMAKNVNETLLDLISQHIGKGAYEATLILAKLREEKCYREDIWT